MKPTVVQCPVVEGFNGFMAEQREKPAGGWMMDRCRTSGRIGRGCIRRSRVWGGRWASIGGAAYEERVQRRKPFFGGGEGGGKGGGGQGE